MERSQVKIEIGCGKTKTEGYIGIDRYPFPGVDIVADVNNGLPFDDNSVDIIYACHSLEHMDNITQVMQEIYRIGKHKCLVLVLAPYYFTSLNIANPYHKLIFVEDTPRFFSDKLTHRIPEIDYECPHAGNWGLIHSDNSSYTMEIEVVHIEYFYYSAYRQLSEEEKRHARRSLLNVCDQLYYILAINKSTDFLTPNELSTLYEQAKTFEPANIAALRQRDAVQTNRTSLITSIRKPLIENISNVSSEIKSLQFNVQDALRLTRKDIESIALDIKQQQEKIGQQGLIIDRQREKIEQQGVVIDRQRENIEELTRTTKQQLDSMKSIAVVTLDITKKQEKTRKFFWKKTDYFLSIQSGHTEFIDALIFRCSMFKPGSILALSRIVPFDTYLEYNLSGSGSQIYFFLFATIGSRLFVEVVVDGIICKQEVFSVIREGPQSVSVQNIGNGAIVRFKTLDNSSIVRVLEVWNRKMRIFARKSLAAYIS